MHGLSEWTAEPHEKPVMLWVYFQGKEISQHIILQLRCLLVSCQQAGLQAKFVLSIVNWLLILQSGPGCLCWKAQIFCTKRHGNCSNTQYIPRSHASFQAYLKRLGKEVYFRECSVWTSCKKTREIENGKAEWKSCRLACIILATNYLCSLQRNKKLLSFC